MAQIDAITGGTLRRRPALSRRAQLEAQAPYIPQMMRAKQDKAYDEAVLDESIRQADLSNAQSQNRFDASMDENRRQFDIRNKQWQSDYDARKDANKTANRFRTAEMILGGASLLNEATDGGVVDWGEGVLKSVMPDSNPVDIIAPSDEIVKNIAEFSKPGDMMAVGNKAQVPDDSILDNAWDYTKGFASAVTPDFIEEPLKKLFSPSSWTGEGGVWSDVSGFVDDIMPDFDFDIPFL